MNWINDCQRNKIARPAVKCLGSYPIMLWYQNGYVDAFLMQIAVIIQNLG